MLEAGPVSPDASHDTLPPTSEIPQSLTSARSVISSALSDVAAPLQEAHTEVLGRIDSTVRDVRPTADRWDTV